MRVSDAYNAATNKSSNIAKAASELEHVVFTVAEHKTASAHGAATVAVNRKEVNLLTGYTLSQLPQQHPLYSSQQHIPRWHSQMCPVHWHRHFQTADSVSVSTAQTKNDEVIANTAPLSLQSPYCLTTCLKSFLWPSLTVTLLRELELARFSSGFCSFPLYPLLTHECSRWAVYFPSFPTSRVLVLRTSVCEGTSPWSTSWQLTLASSRRTTILSWPPATRRTGTGQT